jgi:hypothetical protein
MPEASHAGLTDSQRSTGGAFCFAGVTNFIEPVKLGGTGGQALVVIEELASDAAVAGGLGGAGQTEVGGCPIADAADAQSGALVLTRGAGGSTGVGYSVEPEGGAARGAIVGQGGDTGRAVGSTGGANLCHLGHSSLAGAGGRGQRPDSGVAGEAGVGLVRGRAGLARVVAWVAGPAWSRLL